MQRIRAIWSGLDPARQLVLLLAAAAFVAVLVALWRMATAPGMTLLYAGLDGGQASGVVNALDQRGVAYDVRGDAIFVDSSQRDVLRMTLAGEGLPANSAAGYELLDNLSGFGTTSQMFDAAYWRAKEGELARTLLASPDVREARVHLANPESGPFQRQAPVTASVTLTTRGGGLPEGTAEAFRFLVASAVSGLTPENVSIIDATSGRMIGSAEEAAALGGGERAEQLRANVERILEARVGRGNAVVEISVETVTEAERIRERRIDPDSRVAISSDTEEVTSNERNAGGAGVTVASNLPDGDAAGGDGGSESQQSESRALTNFDVSEVTREVERGPGAIKRLTVAVLINRASLAADAAPVVAEAGGDGEGQDLLATELSDLRELASSAVGLDESRGDVITVKALSFEPTQPAGTAAPQGLLASLALDSMRLIQLAVLALVALALGLFVVRPILSGGRDGAGAAALPGLEGGSAGLPAPMAMGAADFSNAGDVGGDGPIEPLDGDLPALGVEPGFGGFDLDSLGSDSDGPVADLKQLIEERQPDTMAILRNWLEDDTVEETA